MLSGPSFRAAFFFSINSLILPGFSLDLTSINLLKPHYLLFRGFILLCVQLSKNITKCFFLLSFIFLVLILQSPCFICATWKHKQTIEQQPHRSCERIKNKNKTKSRHIPIDHGFYWYRWHCNGIIKGWLYCLTSELKWRFLVNSTNPIFFNKKNKEWTFRALASGRHMCFTSNERMRIWGSWEDP